MAFEQLDANGIQQIWFQDTKLDTPPVLITEALGGTGLGNGHSLRPQISDNGLVVTFHSFASNLVAGDQNDHADVFLYRVLTEQLIRGYNTLTNEEGNGGSFILESMVMVPRWFLNPRQTIWITMGSLRHPSKFLCGTPLSEHLEESMQLLWK